MKAQKDEDDYFDTKKLPDLSVPSNVRDLVYQWRQSLQEHWSKQFNWWLSCNQRSLLTQEELPDTRRSTLKRSRENTGKFYGRKVQEMLKVHDSLMRVLERSDKIQNSRLEDLFKVNIFYMIKISLKF